MGFVSDVKKALGIGSGGRAAQINAATQNAEDGIETEGATIGNPAGKKKKKKISPNPATSPQSSKIPTTLRG